MRPSIKLTMYYSRFYSWRCAQERDLNLSASQRYEALLPAKEIKAIECAGALLSTGEQVSHDIILRYRPPARCPHPTPSYLRKRTLRDRMSEIDMD